MEKIYMEDNSNKTSQQDKKKSVLNLSVGLSFVVAFFAIFSLMVCGISQISYAADTSTTREELTSFTLNINDNDAVEGKVNNNNTSFTVPVLSADNTGKNVFCIEYLAEIPKDNGFTYTPDSEDKDPVATDYGLIYILNNSSAVDTGVFPDLKDASGASIISDYSNYQGSGKSFSDYIKTNTNNQGKSIGIFVTQAAIWLYQNQYCGSNSLNCLTETMTSSIKDINRLAYFDSSEISGFAAPDSAFFSVPNIGAYVSALVDNANYVKNNYNSNLFLSFNSTGGTEMTKSENYYQSGIISLASSGGVNLDSFKLSISSNIEGTVIVDANGDVIDLNSPIDPGTQFFVRIPAENVPVGVSEISLSADGTFNLLKGYSYTGPAYGNEGKTLQKVVFGSTDKTTMPVDMKITVTKAEDTGLSASQTVYFVGLIVLLCGLGIVYANAKPVEIKQ